MGCGGCSRVPKVVTALLLCTESREFAHTHTHTHKTRNNLQRRQQHEEQGNQQFQQGQRQGKDAVIDCWRVEKDNLDGIKALGFLKQGLP